MPNSLLKQSTPITTSCLLYMKGSNIILMINLIGTSITALYLSQKKTSVTKHSSYGKKKKHTYCQFWYTLYTITNQLLNIITLCTLHRWLPSVCHMVDREFHDCTSLQCDRIGLHLCLLHCLVLTVAIGRHIQTLNDKRQCSLPWDIHSTLGSRMVGRKVVQESSQLFVVLKCSTLHMGHCGCGKSEVGQ